jgi:uncharacterized membrane protein YsdA (DUF1294 family)
MIPLAFVLLSLAIANVRAYRAFAKDKQLAIDKATRTPEVVLLRHARWGGWIGAKIAQKRLRHKSYKQPFGSQLDTIGMVQAACLGTFIAVMALLVFYTPQIGAVTTAAAPATPPAPALGAISQRPPAGRP